MTVGDRIKQKRIESGLSVDELAARLGKNRATIYRYESNEIENLPISILEPIAKALDTTPSYLMGWDDESPSCSGHDRLTVEADEVLQPSTSSDVLAAHFDGSEYTAEELDEIRKFAEFVKTKREQGE